MQVTNLVAWLGSPETKALVLYLHQRRAAAVTQFLRTGAPMVDPLTQARASVCNELLDLLAQPADKVSQVFEIAIRETKK